MIQIRLFEPRDRDQIWQILEAINRRGDVFAFSPEMKKEAVLAFWLAPTASVFVAFDSKNEAEILGTFYLKPNQPGLGDHIANGGYAVSEKARGLGIGRKMGVFSIGKARELGFRAMQFNLVVATNPAFELWRSLGFEVIGTIPEAFRHAELGFVDAFIMHQKIA